MRHSKYTLEDKVYTEKSTQQEIEALRSRVFMHSPNIIYYKEIKLMSPFSVNTLFDHADELIVGLDRPGMLIDIRETNVPNTQTRRRKYARFAKISKKIEHASFLIGGNVLVRAVAMFVMPQTKLESYSLHKKLDDAISVLNNKVG